jgi:hypothetical protein
MTVSVVANFQIRLLRSSQNLPKSQAAMARQPG